MDSSKQQAIGILQSAAREAARLGDQGTVNMMHHAVHHLLTGKRSLPRCADCSKRYDPGDSNDPESGLCCDCEYVADLPEGMSLAYARACDERDRMGER